MSSKVRREVVFMEQFYYPEGWGGAQLPRDVTMRLAQRGLAVDVICGSDQYVPAEGDGGANPSAAGVRIRRVPKLFGGAVHSHKLLRQLWFCLAAAPLLLFRARPRVFVTQTNPPLAVVLMALAASVHRRPLVIIAQDLYPEVLFAHGMVGQRSLAARVLNRVFAWAYGRATRVVSLGPVMSERLRLKGVERERIVTISNWATGEEHIVRGPENRLRREWGLEGCFVVVYSGNLGIAHDVETPIRALRECMAELPTLRLLFIGKGSRLSEAQKVAEECGVSAAVQFRPPVPLELLPHSLGLADVALVTLRRGFEGLVVPSKLLGYMARGVATIYIGPPSDAQHLIDESGGGASVANGDVRALSDVYRRLVAEPAALSSMGLAAEEFYREQLSRTLGLQRYEAVIEEVGKCFDAAS